MLITNYTTAKSQVKNGINGMITELSVEGIARGIETLYKNPSLRNTLKMNCENTDFNNHLEIEKLYNIF